MHRSPQDGELRLGERLAVGPFPVDRTRTHRVFEGGSSPMKLSFPLVRLALCSGLAATFLAGLPRPAAAQLVSSSCDLFAGEAQARAIFDAIADKDTVSTFDAPSIGAHVLTTAGAGPVVATADGGLSIRGDMQSTYELTSPLVGEDLTNRDTMLYGFSLEFFPQGRLRATVGGQALQNTIGLRTAGTPSKPEDS